VFEERRACGQTAALGEQARQRIGRRGHDQIVDVQNAYGMHGVEPGGSAGAHIPDLHRRGRTTVGRLTVGAAPIVAVTPPTRVVRQSSDAEARPGRARACKGTAFRRLWKLWQVAIDLAQNCARPTQNQRLAIRGTAALRQERALDLLQVPDLRGCRREARLRHAIAPPRHRTIWLNGFILNHLWRTRELRRRQPVSTGANDGERFG
jgi:hypothetical protein